MTMTVLAALAALAMAVTLAGCLGIPDDGRYQTHGTGWDNFRADAPAIAEARPWIA